MFRIGPSDRLSVEGTSGARFTLLFAEGCRPQPSCGRRLCVSAVGVLAGTWFLEPAFGFFGRCRRDSATGGARADRVGAKLPGESSQGRSWRGRYVLGGPWLGDSSTGPAPGGAGLPASIEQGRNSRLDARGGRSLCSLCWRNRGDCRSRQAAPNLPGTGVMSPGCCRGSSRSSEGRRRCESASPTDAVDGEAPEADPAAAKLRGRWRVSCDAQAAKGTPVDERRLGPATACLLTGARRHRSSAAEAGQEASEGWASSAVRGRKRRRSAALLRCGAPPFALRREGASQARLKLEARRQPNLHLRRGRRKRSRSGNHAVAPVLVL